MVYSGLIYFFIPALVKKISGLSFPRFLNYHFFEPMGLNRITFLPTQKFSKIEIVPQKKIVFSESNLFTVGFMTKLHLLWVEYLEMLVFC